MFKERYLILNDGSLYQGYAFGHDGESIGEVVFNTSMTGYQEMLTDPSYGGQILISTYPMIGNYWVLEGINESSNIQVKSYVIRDLCEEPFHYGNRETLDNFLLKNKIPGIHSIDTRSLTRKIRNYGAKMGIVTNSNNIEEALDKLNNFGKYEDYNYVEEVSSKSVSKFASNLKKNISIALIDFGVKNNIIRILNSRGCDVTVYPWDYDFKSISKLDYDGVVLSPGPGDPDSISNKIPDLKILSDNIPTLGICLGHQILAKLYGGKTFKLLFGHRGGNQPVKDLVTGRVYPTAQNHGFAVSKESFPKTLEVTHLNINDDTISGFKHKYKPILSIQYHSEACPGPVDSEYIFDEFLRNVSQ